MATEEIGAHAASAERQGARGRPIRTWLLGLIFVLGLAWTLRATMMVTLPVAAAVLIALAVAPVCSWVQERVSGRMQWLGYAAAMLLVVGVLALFFAGLALAGQQVASGSRQYLPQMQQQLQNSGLASMLGGSGQAGKALQSASSYFFSAFSMAWNTVAGLVLIFFLVLLMLIEGADWRAKLRTIVGPSSGREWEEAAIAIGQRFRRYFLTRLLLGAITGALYAGWLALFGIDFLLVWALLAFLLNFVPTIGSLIAGLLAVLFAFAQKDPGTAALVAAGLLAIEQVMGNFVDPKLLGRQLSISPLVVLVSLLVWTWMWGAAGALLSVPMTVLVTIIFAHIPALRPVALFLSNERDMAALEERTSPDRTDSAVESAR